MKMSNFEEFWNSSTHSIPQFSDANPQPVMLSSATQDTMAAGVTTIVTENISRIGESVKQSQIDTFSNEVAKYATSSEVISKLSHEVGQPKQDETEDEFVERASNVLREILQKKFKI